MYKPSLNSTKSNKKVALYERVKMAVTYKLMPETKTAECKIYAFSCKAILNPIFI